MTDRIRSLLSTRPLRWLGWIGLAGAIVGLILVWVVVTRLAGATNRAVEPVEETLLEIEDRLENRVQQLTDLSVTARSGSPSDDAATDIATRTEQAAEQLDRIGDALQSAAPAIAVVDRVLPNRFDASLTAALEDRAVEAQGLAAELRVATTTIGSTRTEAFTRIADLAERGADVLGTAGDATSSVGAAVERARSSAVRLIYLIGLVLSVALLWFGLGQAALAVGRAGRK